MASSKERPRGKRLTPRELKVVKLRCGLEDGRLWAPAEVGKKIQVTSMWASMIEERAIRKLIAPSLTRPIRQFLP